MPTILTHAAVGLALAVVLRPRRTDARWWTLATVLPVVPDLDTPFFGAGHDGPWCHRGASHSLAFAAAVAALAVLAFYRRESRARPTAGMAYLAFFFLVTASHGLLDAFTDGGAGIAFLWPLDDTRTFWSTRPIAVAPLSVHGFFTERGAQVFASELRWVWSPAAAVVAIVEVARRLRSRRASGA